MNPLGSRTCFDCQNYSLCFLRHAIDKAIGGASMLNIDSNDAPGRMVQIFETLAMACLKFNPQPESNK